MTQPGLQAIKTQFETWTIGYGFQVLNTEAHGTIFPGDQYLRGNDCGNGL